MASRLPFILMGFFVSVQSVENALLVTGGGLHGFTMHSKTWANSFFRLVILCPLLPMDYKFSGTKNAHPHSNIDEGVSATSSKNEGLDIFNFLLLPHHTLLSMLEMI